MFSRNAISNVLKSFGIILLCFLLLLSIIFVGNQSMKSRIEGKRILIIGNSHSVDSFYLLPLAFRDQYPGGKLTLGVVHYSSCSIDQHLDFSTNEKAVYKYYKNTGLTWKILNHSTMKDILSDQPWDIIFFQAAKSDLDDTLNLDGRRSLEEYVNQYVTNDHEFMWHTSWPSPNDEYFFGKNALNIAPKGYKKTLTTLYGFDPVNQFTVLVNKGKEHILTDKTYSKAVCTGAGIMYAYLKEELPQISIWRDYTHLNDYGRLIVAYSMLAQLDEKEIDNILMKKVPRKFRHSFFRDKGDLILNDAMKKIIISSANYSLSNPYTLPEYLKES